jgi:hypothetical protein
LDIQVECWSQLYRSYNPRVTEEKERVLRATLATFGENVQTGEAQESHETKDTDSHEAGGKTTPQNDIGMVQDDIFTRTALDENRDVPSSVKALEDRVVFEGQAKAEEKNVKQQVKIERTSEGDSKEQSTSP